MRKQSETWWRESLKGQERKQDQDQDQDHIKTWTLHLQYEAQEIHLQPRPSNKCPSNSIEFQGAFDNKHTF